MPSLIESLKAEREDRRRSRYRASSVACGCVALPLLGRARPGPRALVELDEPSPLGQRRARSRCAHRVRRRPRSAWARLRHRGPCASPNGPASCRALERAGGSDVAPASSSTAARCLFGFACGAGLRPRLQPLGAAEPNPTFLLGARGKPPLADAVRQRDAPLRPVAMDKVMLGALPVGKSRLVLIGNLLKPRRVSLSPRGRG